MSEHFKFIFHMNYVIEGNGALVNEKREEQTNLQSIWHFPVIIMHYLLKFQDLSRICHGTSPGMKANDQELDQYNTG